MLAAQNLRWGGGIDADTGLCSYLTDFGVAAGLEVGEPLRVASDTLSGLYWSSLRLVRLSMLMQCVA